MLSRSHYNRYILFRHQTFGSNRLIQIISAPKQAVQLYFAPAVGGKLGSLFAKAGIGIYPVAAAADDELTRGAVPHDKAYALQQLAV